MTDNFKCIYKILRALEKAMDYPEFDISQINHEKLGISQERTYKLIGILAEEKYISCTQESYQSIDGTVTISPTQLRLTFKGLQYLTENKTMRKYESQSKGIKVISE